MVLKVARNSSPVTMRSSRGRDLSNASNSIFRPCARASISSSIWVMISPSASIPITIARSGIPSSKSSTPKVMRGVEASESRPTVLASMPQAPAMSPLVMDLPTTAAMKVRANSIRAVSSDGPIVNARMAKGAATTNRIRSEKLSPTTEA